MNQVLRKGSSISGVPPKKSQQRRKTEGEANNAREARNAVRNDGLGTSNCTDGFAGGAIDLAGSMINLSVESSVQITVSDWESSSIHRGGGGGRGRRRVQGTSRPSGGTVGAAERPTARGGNETGGEKGGGGGGGDGDVVVGIVVGGGGGGGMLVQVY